MLLMCLLGEAVPKGAVPLPFLTEVPRAQGPFRCMGSFLNSRLTERGWPGAWGTDLLPHSPVHGIENVSPATCVASQPQLVHSAHPADPGVFIGKTVRCQGLLVCGARALLSYCTCSPALASKVVTWFTVHIRCGFHVVSSQSPKSWGTNSGKPPQEGCFVIYLRDP